MEAAPDAEALLAALAERAGAVGADPVELAVGEVQGEHAVVHVMAAVGGLAADGEQGLRGVGDGEDAVDHRAVIAAHVVGRAKR